MKFESKYNINIFIQENAFVNIVCKMVAILFRSWCVKTYGHDNISLSEVLTHWGQVTHICIVKLTIIGSDNGLSPGRRQAIIWTNAGILLIGPLGTNFSEILIGIKTFWFKKMHLKMSSGKWRPFCPSLNVLMDMIFYNRMKWKLSHHWTYCMYKQWNPT